MIDAVVRRGDLLEEVAEALGAEQLRRAHRLRSRGDDDELAGRGRHRRDLARLAVGSDRALRERDDLQDLPRAGLAGEVVAEAGAAVDRQPLGQRRPPQVALDEQRPLAGRGVGGGERRGDRRLALLGQRARHEDGLDRLVDVEELDVRAQDPEALDVLVGHRAAPVGNVRRVAERLDAHHADDGQVERLLDLVGVAQAAVQRVAHEGEADAEHEADQAAEDRAAQRLGRGRRVRHGGRLGDAGRGRVDAQGAQRGDPIEQRRERDVRAGVALALRAQVLVLLLDALRGAGVALALGVLLDRHRAARDLVGERGREGLVVRRRLDGHERARRVDARREHRAQLRDREVALQAPLGAVEHVVGEHRRGAFGRELGRGLRRQRGEAGLGVAAVLLLEGHARRRDVLRLLGERHPRRDSGEEERDGDDRGAAAAQNAQVVA